MAYRQTEKTEARKRAQHKLILSSALEVVSENGFLGLTIVAVADRAGLATGTVYKYFLNKADLCREVFQVASTKELEALEHTFFENEQESCKTRLINAIRSFSGRAIEGHRIAHALLAEPVDPLIESERLVYRRAFAELFARLIQEGIDREEFSRQDSNITANAIVGALAESLIGPLSIIGVAGPHQLDVREFIESVLQFCLKAVISDPVPITVDSKSGIKSEPELV